MPGKHLEDEFLKEIAEKARYYRQLPGKRRSNVMLAAEYGVAVSMAYSWVKAARHRGFLEEYVPNECHECGQLLGDVPPWIPRAHCAAISRMEANSYDLQDRCDTLAKEADMQGHGELAVELRRAALMYESLARTLGRADVLVKKIEKPRRLGEGTKI